MVQYKRDGVISPLTDLVVLQSNDLVIGEYDDLQYTEALNRNMSVLFNRLYKKMSKNKKFDATDIECNAPVGYILVTDGPGIKPYWIDPILYKMSLSENEIVKNEKVLFDYSTFNASYFTLSGASISDRLTFTEGTALINTLTVSNTQKYQLKVKISPIKRDILLYTPEYFIISGADFNDTYKLFVTSDVGLIEIKPTSIVVEGTNVKVTTSTQYKTLYKAYYVSLKSEIVVNTSLIEQHIEETLLDGDDLLLVYSARESNTTNIGAKFTSKNSVIKYILIDLYAQG